MNVWQNANLVQFISHHGTDSVRVLGLLCRTKMLRAAGMMVVIGTRNLFLNVSRSSHFWTNLALVPHGRVKIS